MRARWRLILAVEGAVPCGAARVLTGMLQREERMSNQATVQDRTHQRCADLLVKAIFEDEPLRTWQILLCQTLASRHALTHPICKGLASVICPL